MTSNDKKTDQLTNEFDDSQVPVIYELNQETVEKARRIKSELNVIIDRLARLEEHQSTVSEAVYQKLKNEYLQKQNEVAALFADCKREIRHELKNLINAGRENTTRLSAHQLTVEEVKLRGILGEFDDEKVREIETRENKIIEEFEAAGTKIKNDIAILEEITGESFELTGPDEPGEAISLHEDHEALSTIPGIQTGVLLETGLSNNAPDEENFTRQIDADESTDDSVFNVNDATIAIVNNENQGSVEDLSTGQHIDLEEEATICVQTPSSGNEDQTLEEESNLSHATITIYEQENKIGEHLFKSECRIGRTRTADIFLKDDTVSRNHALIVRKGDEYHISDQNSANGVLVNSERVTEAILKNGDAINIGIFTLIIKFC